MENKEENMMGNCVQKPNQPETENSTGNLQMKTQVKTSENLQLVAKLEDTLEVFSYSYTIFSYSRHKLWHKHHRKAAKA